MPAYSPKQARALLEPPKRWNFLVGAARSGKTYVQYDILPIRARRLPKGNAFLIGKTLGTLTKNVIRPMQERFGTSQVSDIRNRGGANEIWAFGRRFYVVGAQDESSLKYIQGVGMVYANCDEMALYPKTFVEMLKSRLSEPGACCDATFNPEGPRHFIKTDFIDRAEEIDLRYIHFTLDDNPYLDPSFVSALKSEYKGVWYKRLILGLWVAAEGAIYDMFDEDVHVVDVLPPMVHYWVAGDYGTTNPTVFLLIGLGSDGCYYVVDEYRYDSVEHGGHRQTGPQYADDLKKFVAGHKVYPQEYFFDPSAVEFIELLRQHPYNMDNVTGANNEVTPGIRRVGAQFGTRKLFIHSRCKGLILEIMGYLWDSKAQERGEDAPVKQADHGPDALRYFVNEVIGKQTQVYTWS